MLCDSKWLLELCNFNIITILFPQMWVCVCLLSFKMPVGWQDTFLWHGNTFKYYHDMSYYRVISFQSQVHYLNCSMCHQVQLSSVNTPRISFLLTLLCCFARWMMALRLCRTVGSALCFTGTHVLLFVEVTTLTPSFHCSGYSSFHFCVGLLCVHEHKK